MKKALWVDALGDKPLLGELTRLPDLQTFMKDWKITDLYIQVVRSGKCWFNLTNGYFFKQQEKDRDPLGDLINYFSDLNVNIHAWINVFNLGMEWEGIDDRILQRDRLNRSITSYLSNDASLTTTNSLQLDSPGYWVDPCNAFYHEKFIEMIGNLHKSYPELAGVHLDFFRYPYCLPISPLPSFKYGVDFGYTESALKMFQSEFNIRITPEELMTEETALKWNQFRRSILERYLKEIRSIVRDRELSIAVIPWSDRAYLNAFQDWRGWLEREMVDKICLMSYTADLTHFSHLIKQALPFRTEHTQVIAGIGTYKLDKRETLDQLIGIADQLGADGVALFSYRTLQERLLTNSQDIFQC